MALEAVYFIVSNLGSEINIKSVGFILALIVIALIFGRQKR